jgi:hypothetical protein
VCEKLISYGDQTALTEWINFSMTLLTANSPSTAGFETRAHRQNDFDTKTDHNDLPSAVKPPKTI